MTATTSRIVNAEQCILGVALSSSTSLEERLDTLELFLDFELSSQFIESRLVKIENNLSHRVADLDIEIYKHIDRDRRKESLYARMDSLRVQLNLDPFPPSATVVTEDAQPVSYILYLEQALQALKLKINEFDKCTIINDEYRITTDAHSSPLCLRVLRVERELHLQQQHPVEEEEPTQT
eukprot:11173405-Ditylum_brightwellii.AAC.1